MKAIRASNIMKVLIKMEYGSECIEHLCGPFAKNCEKINSGPKEEPSGCA